MRVNVLALDGVFDLGLAAVTGRLPHRQRADRSVAAAGARRSTFDVVGVRRAVKTSNGLGVPVQTASARAPECVVVPAIGFKMPGPLAAALARPDIADAAALLRRWARPDTTMAAACIGTFVLAESGLLDGERATTTWWLAPMFRQRYPRVRLDESNMIVSSGRCVTAGAALSHVDLALWLVRQREPGDRRAHRQVSDHRLAAVAVGVRARRPPGARRPDRAAVRAWARARLADGFSLDDAARAVGASKRTLARRMQSVLGKSPLAYVQSLRVERAVHLLKTGGASVDDVAAQVGYADGVTLRALLRRRLKVGVKAIRAQA